MERSSERELDTVGDRGLRLWIETEDKQNVARLQEECFSCFKKLHNIITRASSGEADMLGYNRDISLACIEEEMVRFDVWRSRAATLCSDPSGWRDVTDSQLTKRKQNILGDMLGSLTRASLIVSGLEANEMWSTEGVSDSDESTDNKDTQQKAPQTCEIEDLLASLEGSNKRLVRLAGVDINSVAQDDLPSSTSFSDADMRLVKNKFKHAQQGSGWLLERLAKSMTKRREHLIKLQLGRTQESMHEAGKSVVTSTPSSQLDGKGETKPQKPTLHSTKDWEHLIALNLESSEDAKGNLDVKSLSKCPYCGHQVMITNQREWESHVSEDLKPYICTFESCIWRTFSNCDDWFSHELQTHRREWVCQQQCPRGPVSNRVAFAYHLGHSHSADIDSSDLKGVLLQSEEPMDRFGEGACLLCKQWDETVRGENTSTESIEKGRSASAELFKNHLASHLKDIVAWTVPEDSEGLLFDLNTSTNRQEHSVGVMSVTPASKDEPQLSLAETNNMDSQIHNVFGQRYAALLQKARQGSAHLSSGHASDSIDGDSSDSSDSEGGRTTRTRSTWTTLDSEYGGNRSATGRVRPPSFNENDVSVSETTIKNKPGRFGPKKIESWPETDKGPEAAKNIADQIAQDSKPGTTTVDPGQFLEGDTEHDQDITVAPTTQHPQDSADKGLVVAIKQPEDVVAEQNPEINEFNES
ncbi:hypothetical protein GLAREA_06060 [Glarea lozoyensis ATCC 20868]|uniref:Oxidoreductase acuF-like C2H2 type zinc-finger domain-containing protein n=1 Tax=Glarea lozoyensis (strain ATCC 20868 / MF5171) TaxID=1116229 RepID=S3E3N2_GLAL2|nr:uncharacterized protein GLAREA_06060 [Glarea lozoyensis ATCC 20868]EPE33048.1 hypothetical protein GLAREA_06060 [Glarea lozoyensis ATCC 20868]